MAAAAVLLAAGLGLTWISLPALPARGEFETPQSPTKAITIGSQQGSYDAARLDADDGSLDGTSPVVVPSTETQSATAATTVTHGTQTGTWADTVTDDNSFHQVRAVDTFGPPATTTPTSPTKQLRYGFQGGATYVAGNVNTDDGSFDVTDAKSATNQSSPSLRSPTLSEVTGWTTPSNAMALDGFYATTSVGGTVTAWWGFGFDVPTHATITKVEVRLEWHATNTNGCLDVRTSLNGGNTWSSYATTSAAALIDRVDTVDVTAQQSGWRAGVVNWETFRVGVRSNHCGGGLAPTWNLDQIDVRMTFTYNVEHSYTFTVGEPENHWTKIEVRDSSAADPGCAAALYRPGAGVWDNLGWALSTTEGTHSTQFTTALTSYVNASNELRVRYRCAGIAAAESVRVDLVSIIVTYTPYEDTELLVTYEAVTTRRAEVTGLTFSDRSLRAVGSITVEAYDWTAATWRAAWTVAETAETGHSFTPGVPADFIDAATGALRVRYRSTTTPEGSLPESHVDLLMATIDYRRYSVDVTFEFTSTLPKATWKRLWVNDSAAAAPGTQVHLWNFVTSGWTLLGGSYTATEAAHTFDLTSAVPDHGDAGNRLRVRYAGISVEASTALQVDLLAATVSANTDPTLVSFSATDDKAGHDDTVLNDDDLDWTEVRGVVEDANGEEDAIRIEVRLRSTYDGSTTTYGRDVTAGDRGQNLEPASLDAAVVVWNPVEGDDRLSFKLQRIWRPADRTNPDAYEFTVAVRDTFGLAVFGSVITRTLEVWDEIIINDGFPTRVYDRTGTPSTGSWGQWTSTPGVVQVASGSGPDLTGRYVKIYNVGTGYGSTTVSFDGSEFVGVGDTGWTIPIWNSIDFKHYTGGLDDPSQVPSWTTTVNDADGALTLNVGPGQYAWVWYTIDVPEPSTDQTYQQTFTIG